MGIAVVLLLTIGYNYFSSLLMLSFTVTYTVKFELYKHPEYVWNEFNECYNLKTGRRIRQTYKNGMIGYCIRGKFKSLKSLKPLLRKPIESDCPF